MARFFAAGDQRLWRLTGRGLGDGQLVDGELHYLGDDRIGGVADALVR